MNIWNPYRALIIIYLVGLVGHAFMPFRPFMIAITPLTLFITGMIVLSNELRGKNFRLFAWLILTIVVTHMIEALGVATGLIFGSYTYGTALGWKFFEVPIIIGFNWAMVLYCSISVASIQFKNPLTLALISATLLIVLDFFIEPVAIALGYWQWSGDSIPIKNFFAWWCISFIMTLVYCLFSIHRSYHLPAYYFLILLGYFIFFNGILILSGGNFPRFDLNNF